MADMTVEQALDLTGQIAQALSLGTAHRGDADSLRKALATLRAELDKLRAFREYAPMLAENSDDEDALSRMDSLWSAMDGECRAAVEPIVRAVNKADDLRAELDGLRKKSSRAYVAEQMRGLVPKEYQPAGRAGSDHMAAAQKNACRAETLANIERWEKANEGQ